MDSGFCSNYYHWAPVPKYEMAKPHSSGVCSSYCKECVRKWVKFCGFQGNFKSHVIKELGCD